jgi:hypothetical protein
MSMRSGHASGAAHTPSRTLSRKFHCKLTMRNSIHNLTIRNSIR